MCKYSTHSAPPHTTHTLDVQMKPGGNLNCATESRSEMTETSVSEKYGDEQIHMVAVVVMAAAVILHI